MSEILKDVFKCSDTDGNSKINGKEFRALMSGQNSPVANALMMLGIREDRLWDVWRQVFEEEVAGPDAGGGGADGNVMPQQLRQTVQPNSDMLEEMNFIKELTFKEFMD